MNTAPSNPTELLQGLRYRPLNRTWAKMEILLGLTATGLGLFLGDWAISSGASGVEWEFVAGALALFVLGSYLTLAGHRSHLYQSSNELTAYLIAEIRRLKAKAESS